jgi:hypothetical protein
MDHGSGGFVIGEQLMVEKSRKRRERERERGGSERERRGRQTAGWPSELVTRRKGVEKEAQDPVEGDPAVGVKDEERDHQTEIEKERERERERGRERESVCVKKRGPTRIGVTVA